MEQDLNESESVTEIETNEPEAIESDEPESMLEAIQEGLKPDEEKPEEAPKEEVKAEEEPKPENEDEPPEGISKKAQERFRSMVTKVKEKDVEIEHLKTNLNEITQMVRETGGTPEDFQKTFEYIKAIRSGDLNQARSMLEEQIRQLSIATGQSFGQVDPLAKFPDLRERVNAYQMDEQTALEMARHRAIQNEQMQAQHQYQQRAQNEQQMMQTRQRAIAEIDHLGSEWAKTDPDYAMKEELIAKQAQVISQQFPPHQWAAQVKLMYQTLSSMPMQRPQTNSPAPLRASGQTAGARQPGSMLEALQNGLGYK
jgi:hypothetical protein